MPAAKVCPSKIVPKQKSINSINIENSDSINYSNDSISTKITVLRDSITNDSNLTPYQRIMRCLNEDERWQKEIALGRRIGFYRFRGEIGSGNFSQVKVAIHSLTKEKVAIKILDKCKLDSKTQKMLLREISSMELLHHPNLIRIFEVIETLSKLYLVMEYAPNGELFQRISEDGKLDEKCVKPLFAQIVAAIDHMHQNNIIHRDIKAENVFYADYKTVKVGDFGFSTRISEKEELLSTFCGSPPYAAPELFHDQSYVGPYVDYWALGVLLYFMVTALMPFKAQTISSLKKLILEGIYEIPEYVSHECSAIIKDLLQHKPDMRLNLNQLKSCEWLNSQNFPKFLPKYELITNDSNNENLSLNYCSSFEERETYKQMKDLGIDNNMINESLNKGSRSNVTGTYRILINKIINNNCKKNNSFDKTEEYFDVRNADSVIVTDSVDGNESKRTKSISKSIKSIKNAFKDKAQKNIKFERNINHECENQMKNVKKCKKSKTCCIL